MKKRRSLQDELEELERADPKVGAARKKYDAVVAAILNKPLDPALVKPQGTQEVEHQDHNKDDPER